MAFCSYANHNTLFEVTPVENLFILEFMLRAPGDYVKVYLYGLMLCKSPQHAQEGLHSFARALDMETEQVLSAFEYWQRQGIVKRVGEDPLEYAFNNIASTMMEQEQSAQRDIYKYREFNAQAQQLFGSRILTAQDYEKIYDWMEIFGMEADAVLLLIEHYVQTGRYKQKTSLQTLERHVKEWVEVGVKTLPEAQEHIQRLKSLRSGTASLLRHLGISRLPTVDESALYDKWTGELHFTHEQILDACKELTKIREPNFNYLDRVLSRRASEMESAGGAEALAQQDQYHEQVKKALFAMGKPGTPSPAHVKMYAHWREDWGFSPETIELACEQCVLRGNNSFEAVEALLGSWKQRDLVDHQSVVNTLEDESMLKEDTLAVLQRAGIDRMPSRADTTFVRRWTQEWNLNIELVFLCAEFAQQRENPMVYMDKVLGSWREKGITSLREARQEHEATMRRGSEAPSRQQSGGKKQLQGLNYTQRQYDKDEYNALVEDLLSD